MILLRVLGTVVEVADKTDVLFDGGVDWVEQFQPGETFALEVEVAERDGDRMVVRPVGPYYEPD